MAQHAPTKATSRKLDDEGPNPMRAEAIAMRRIVVEQGRWLSPLLRDHPIPVLTEWERTVDLSKLDHNAKSRQLAADRAAQSQRVLDKIDNPQLHKGERHRSVGTPTVVDVQIARTKTPATRTTLQARKARQHEVAELAKAQGKSPAEVERELALARVTAIAAQKAAEEAKAAAKVDVEARKARRRETARAANRRYNAKCDADPVFAEQRRQKKRAAERKNYAAKKAKRAPQAVATTQPAPNPRRDPTLPTARELREEAIRAAAIEAEQRRAKSARHR